MYANAWFPEETGLSGFRNIHIYLQSVPLGGAQRDQQPTQPRGQISIDRKVRKVSWISRNLDSTTLQGINMSHLEKRKIIFKMDFSGDMLVPRRVVHLTVNCTNLLVFTLSIEIPTYFLREQPDNVSGILFEKGVKKSLPISQPYVQQVKTVTVNSRLPNWED